MTIKDKLGILIKNPNTRHLANYFNLLGGNAFRAAGLFNKYQDTKEASVKTKLIEYLESCTRVLNLEEELTEMVRKTSIYKGTKKHVSMIPRKYNLGHYITDDVVEKYYLYAMEVKRRTGYVPLHHEIVAWIANNTPITKNQITL